MNSSNRCAVSYSNSVSTTACRSLVKTVPPKLKVLYPSEADPPWFPCLRRVSNATRISNGVSRSTAPAKSLSCCFQPVSATQHQNQPGLGVKRYPSGGSYAKRASLQCSPLGFPAISSSRLEGELMSLTPFWHLKNSVREPSALSTLIGSLATVCFR